jgi:hypothetical protein
MKCHAQVFASFFIKDKNIGTIMLLQTWKCGVVAVPMIVDTKNE